MCAIQIDGNDGSDADEHKDSRYFLTKIDKKERLGERENGKPVKFFDDSDVGILQSNVFLQDLPASEFKEGSDGSLNSKWANYLKNGTEKYIIPGMPVDLGWELTWNASFNGTELEIAKETEKSWAQSHLDAWTTIGVFLADFPPFKIGDSITKVGMDFTLSDQFISVQNTILNNTDELNENNIGTKDGLFSTLEKIISDSTTLSELPGEADTIILSKYKYHEAGISPGNIIDIINEIIGDKDTVDSNLANFSSINSFIQSFKNAFEANIGYIVSNEPMGVKYTHKENTEEIYYSDPKAASYNNEEVLPEGENLEDYDSEIYKFPVFDDFRENIFGEVKGGDTIVSGIQYINELIKNKSLINLVDTPTGYIGHSGEYLIVNTGESGIYFTGIEKIAQDLTDYGFIGGDGITGFTGLYDTPTGYQEHSGHYLVVNDGETGVHFTGIEKIAQDLTNYGFVGGEGSNHFTGLQDTPSDYNSGHYLRSTDNGIEYAEPSELGQDVLTNTTGLASGYLRIDDDGTGIVIVGRETFKGEIDLQTDFTGLQDTPSDYSEGDYLRSTSNGLEYVTTSGLAQDIGDEIVNNIVTGDLLGFTGLNDTPTGYETGKFVRVNSAGDAVEYSDISFLNDVIDAPESQLVSGFLKLDKDGKLVWSPATTDGDVSFTITGATHFTGLLDTPNTYDNNKFLAFDAFKNQITGVELKLASSFYGPADVINNPHDLAEVGDKKILEYHRTQEHGYEIKWVDQITGITTFSGLNGTPADYQEGKYLRSTADGLEYVDITGLAEEVSAEIDFPEGATGFTGLHDTPADYKNYEDRYFVVSSGDSLSYEQIKFLENVKDAPNVNNVPSDGTGYLQLVQESNEWILKWAPGTIEGDITQNFQGTEYFTGLEDTPTDYQEGKYLRSTANGLEYIDITGLAEEVSSEIDFPEGVTRFTGLNDTPTGYQGHSGDYLVVNDNESGIHFTGIEKIAADLTDYGFGGDGGSSTIPSYTDLPDVTENDGKIVASGCDLYHSCNGTWNKIGGGTSSSEDLPGCVNNLEEYMQYEEYKQGVIGESSLDFFNAGINDNIEPLVIDACLYADSSLQNELNEVFIQESTFKWGIFTEPQTINISAVSHSESSDSFCSFSHWSSLNNSINGSTNANESFFLDVDTDITGHFDCFYPPGEASFEELLFGLQSNTINNSTTIEDYSSNNYTINTGGVINVDNTSHIDPIYGSSSFFFDQTRAMQFTPNESMSLGTSFTIEGWIYILSYANANVNGSVFLIGQSHTASSNNNVFSLAYNNNHKIAFHIYDSNGQLFMLADSSGPLSLNEWHHMAVVRDKNKLTSYLNGVALDTKDMGTLPVRTSSQNIHIGRIPTSANSTDSSYPQEHHGYMQDIRIVKRALYTSNFSVPSNFPTYK